MTIALHTRSTCDLCERPAVIDMPPDIFLCEVCDQRLHGAVENSIPPVCFASGANTSTAAADLAPSACPAAADVPFANPLAGSQTVAAVSCVEHIDAVAAVTVSFESEVATLEREWARDGIIMNASTFFVSAETEIKSNSSA